MHPIVGTWQLDSFTFHLQGADRVGYPYGEDVSGVLVYDSVGCMTVMIVGRSRPLLNSDDPDFITEAEKAALAEKYMAYGGRYEIDGEIIRHHIEVSFVPNWVGTIKKRTFTLHNDCLTLETPPTERHGGTWVGRLTWHRITA